MGQVRDKRLEISSWPAVRRLFSVLTDDMELGLSETAGSALRHTFWRARDLDPDDVAHTLLVRITEHLRDDLAPEQAGRSVERRIVSATAALQRQYSNDRQRARRTLVDSEVLGDPLDPRALPGADPFRLIGEVMDHVREKGADPRGLLIFTLILEGWTLDEIGGRLDLQKSYVSSLKLKLAASVKKDFGR